MRRNGEEDRGGKTREITYQVGWKKGRIQIGDDSTRQLKPAPEEAPPSGMNATVTLLHRSLREAPLPSGQAAFRLALALPVVVFALTALLLYLLLN